MNGADDKRAGAIVGHAKQLTRYSDVTKGNSISEYYYFELSMRFHDKLEQRQLVH